MDSYLPTPLERLQEATDLLARAFEELDAILALEEFVVGELIVRPDPPWAQIMPQPPPAAKFINPDRILQRTVKASGQLGAAINGIT